MTLGVIIPVIPLHQDSSSPPKTAMQSWSFKNCDLSKTVRIKGGSVPQIVHLRQTKTTYFGSNSCGPWPLLILDSARNGAAIGAVCCEELSESLPLTKGTIVWRKFSMFLLFFMEEFRVEEDHVSPPRPWHTWVGCYPGYLSPSSKRDCMSGILWPPFCVEIFSIGG